MKFPIIWRVNSKSLRNTHCWNQKRNGWIPKWFNLITLLKILSPNSHRTLPYELRGTKFSSWLLAIILYVDYFLGSILTYYIMDRYDHKQMGIKIYHVNFMIFLSQPWMVSLTNGTSLWMLKKVGASFKYMV